jgi:hypothetical protein
MSKQTIQPLFSNPMVQDDFYEDFQHLDLVGVWADIGDTAHVISPAGTSSALTTTGGTIQDQAWLATNRKWLLSQYRPLLFEVQMNYAEVNTDDANVLLGFDDVPALDIMTDSGGGTDTSYDGFNFHKKFGDTQWSVESSNAGTQVTNMVQSTRVQPGGGVWQKFRIIVDPISSTVCNINYALGIGDNANTAGGTHFEICKDYTTGNIIQHQITMTGLVAMAAVIGAKTGVGTTQTLLWDYVRVSQVK